MSRQITTVTGQIGGFFMTATVWRNLIRCRHCSAPLGEYLDGQVVIAPMISGKKRRRTIVTAACEITCEICGTRNEAKVAPAEPEP